MSSDSYFFPHDYNAKDDAKCEVLIERMGVEGYGIFWILLETLRAQPDYTYPIANIPIIARRYNTDAEKVSKVVLDFELFAVKNNLIFFSPGLNKRMQPLIEKRNRMVAGGKKGAALRWGDNRSCGDATNYPNGIPSEGAYSKKSKEEYSRAQNSKEDHNNDFESFWYSYHDITGLPKTDKFAASELWEQLTSEERINAVRNIEAYYDSLDNSKYCKKARTYLADKTFNDEYGEAGKGFPVPR